MFFQSKNGTSFRSWGVKARHSYPADIYDIWHSVNMASTFQGSTWLSVDFQVGVETRFLLREHNAPT